MGYEQVRCPWEAKGTVMRLITEEHQDENVDLTDGIKIHSEGGWALVLPDSFEPVFHIYSEGTTPEHAQGLLSRFRTRIEELQVGVERG
jgi:mannose-1-phosphate guanylyltransferase/phosphomannomutase